MNIFSKLNLLRKLNGPATQIEEGVKMKNYIKVIGGLVAFLTILGEAYQEQIGAFVAHHPGVAVGIVGAIKLALLCLDPKAKAEVAAAAASQRGSCTLRPMIAVMVIAGVLLFVVPCFAQAPQITNLYAAGVSFNNGASPAVAGTALYARAVSDSGTYAFTVADFVPQSVKPFTVTSNVGGGVAQRIFTVGKVPIYVPTSAGISFNGSNTGWAWSAGAMAAVKVKGNFRLMPTVRIVKSSVSNGAGYQPIASVLFGWGQ